MLRAYICHPYSADPVGNAEKVLEICKRASEQCLPIAPQIYLPQFVDESAQRARAMRMCLELLAVSDEVWVYGDEASPGMAVEIEVAKKLNKLVRRMS